MIEMNDDSLPTFVYTGNKYKYWDTRIIPEYQEEILLQLFRELNEEMFDNSIKEPSFIIFSKFCFKAEVIRTFGTFQRYNEFCHPGNEYKYGIYISVEDYLIRGIESVKKTLIHEMIHAKLWQERKQYHDGDVDFIYYSGWYKSELYHESLSYSPELEKVKSVIDFEYKHIIPEIEF